MSRTPATIHHINETLHSNNYEESDTPNAHDNFYNYVPNSEYDGGFFYGGQGASSNTGNGIDLSVF